MIKEVLAEFKEFAVKGNVIDMAVGIIIGGAFSPIVKSLVDDIIMPVISLITGGIDFNNWFVALDGKEYETLAAAQEAGASDFESDEEFFETYEVGKKPWF